MKILSMGDRIRPGRHAVRDRFERSLLLAGPAGRLVFVVDRSIGPGPLNLVVATPHAFVAGGTLTLSRRMEAPIFDSSLPSANGAQLRRVMETALPRHAPPDSLVSLFFPSGSLPRFQQARDRLFRKALAHITAGRIPAGVRLIRGCGAGLTPAGDDFLAGWMLACHLQRQAAIANSILKHARGENPVSNALLELAAQGRVNRATKQLLQGPAAPRVKAVCAFGHTSGADLLCGLWWGLANVSPPP
jgi:hypothetical protein